MLRVANEALRFQPPEALTRESEQTSGPRSGGGQSFGRGRQALLQRLTKLGVEPEKIEQIGAEMGTQVSKLRQQMQGGGFDRGQFRLQIRALRDRLLAKILSAEQLTAFEKSIKSRSDSRPGEIWVEDTDGIPQRRRIRLGISDDRFTEIISGKIEEGEKAITRIRAIKS